MAEDGAVGAVRSLRERSSPLAVLLDGLPIAIVVVDDRGTIVLTNSDVERLTGYGRDELMGRDVETLVPADRRGAHRDHRDSFMREPRMRPMGTSVKTTCRRRDGTEFPVDIHLSTVVLDGATLVVAALRDDTERLAYEAGLVDRALHDPLTGLANRVMLTERLENALLRLRSGRSQLAVLFLDLDRFKDINDAWGHSVGDEVLIAVAGRLRDNVRPGDTVSRFGGDEFVILCEDIASPAAAIEVCDRLLQQTEQPVGVSAGRFQITASIGVVVAARPVEPAVLLHEADAAVYAAKVAGRARWELRQLSDSDSTASV